MKFNKNNLQNSILFISAASLMATMLSILTEGSGVQRDSEDILILGIMLVLVTSIVYAFLVIKRITPKKYIYISYSSQDEEIEKKMSLILNDQFKKLSKYRFEIIDANSIHFGYDMNDAMKENLEKSDIVIIIVSPAYLQSSWCKKEFTTISNEDKQIIPIVTESFSDLAKLPKDISNIKALSLENCVTEEDFSNSILILAKDLIKQRRD